MGLTVIPTIFVYTIFYVGSIEIHLFLSHEVDIVSYQGLFRSNQRLCRSHHLDSPHPRCSTVPIDLLPTEIATTVDLGLEKFPLLIGCTTSVRKTAIRSLWVPSRSRVTRIQTLQSFTLLSNLIYLNNLYPLPCIN
jgi:hypothetical protein